MGIHGLMKLIGDYAPSSMKDCDIKAYFGKISLLWVESVLDHHAVHIPDSYYCIARS